MSEVGVFGAEGIYLVWFDRSESLEFKGGVVIPVVPLRELEV